MEKQLTIEAATENGRGTAEMVKKAVAMAAGAVAWLQGYYEDVLGRRLTTAQMRMLVEAQVAFTACILPADFSLALRSVFGVWLLSALMRCRRALA